MCISVPWVPGKRNMAEPDQAAFSNARYAANEYLFGTQPNAFLARESHRLAPGSKVLAIADGEGRNSDFLAQHGHRGVATDGSDIALAKASPLLEKRGAAVEYRGVGLKPWARHGAKM